MAFARARRGGQLVADILAPAARRRAQVDDDLARLDQLVLFVDLLELVGRARAIAFALRQLDVGIVDMVVQPRLPELVLGHFS